MIGVRGGGVLERGRRVEGGCEEEGGEGGVWRRGERGAGDSSIGKNGGGGEQERAREEMEGAEGGIRDVCLSRGLGDGYKGQGQRSG